MSWSWKRMEDIYPGWDQAPETNLQHQWDATELTHSDGDPVNTWSDSYGSLDASLAGSNAPSFQSDGINGNPSVHFNQTASGLDTASQVYSQPNSIYIVFQYVSGEGYGTRYMYDGCANNSNNDRHLFAERNGNFGIWSGAWLENMSINTDPGIGAHIYDGSNSRNWINGTATTGSTDTNSFDGMMIGNRFELNDHGMGGLIGEILVYNDRLSEEQDQRVIDYLSQKWGITY